jgi:hypothetical protein
MGGYAFALYKIISRDKVKENHPFQKNKEKEMNSVSSHLLSFLSEHLLPKKTNQTQSSFSILSRTFLSNIFQRIHDAHHLWYEHYQNILKSELAYDYQHMSHKHTMIPPEIKKKYIDAKPREKIFQRKFSIPVGNKLFDIYIWFPITVSNMTSLPKGHSKKNEILMSHKQIQEKIIHILKKVYLWLHVVCSYLPKTQKCSNLVEVYLFLTEYQKNLPHHHDIPVDVIHANTAFTTGCIAENTSICVFREEEWFKVLMHETCHTLGLDFIAIDHPSINTRIKKTFPIAVDDIRVYEVYAEMWAEIMNVLFVVYEMDPPARKGRLPMIRWIATLEKAFLLEQTFSLFQANKVLAFQKMKYSDILDPHSAKHYKENTYIFSYFILKSIWMVHINEFLEFCAKQSGDFSIQFDLSSSKNLNLFLSDLVTFATSKKYLSEMSRIRDLSIPILDKKKKGDFLVNTLRMTCLELG